MQHIFVSKKRCRLRELPTRRALNRQLPVTECATLFSSIFFPEIRHFCQFGRRHKIATTRKQCHPPGRGRMRLLSVIQTTTWIFHFIHIPHQTRIKRKKAKSSKPWPWIGLATVVKSNFFFFIPTNITGVDYVRDSETTKAIKSICDGAEQLREQKSN